MAVLLFSNQQRDAPRLQRTPEVPRQQGAVLRGPVLLRPVPQQPVQRRPGPRAEGALPALPPRLVHLQPLLRLRQPPARAAALVHAEQDARLLRAPPQPPPLPQGAPAHPDRAAGHLLRHLQGPRRRLPIGSLTSPPAASKSRTTSASPSSATATASATAPPCRQSTAA